MSIIPGIENGAPERTETSSGSSASPSCLPIFFSSVARARRDLVHEAGRQLVAQRHVGVARLGRDREAGRYRQAEVRHLGEVGALAAEQVLLVAAALFERVDVLLRHLCSDINRTFSACGASVDDDRVREAVVHSPAVRVAHPHRDTEQHDDRAERAICSRNISTKVTRDDQPVAEERRRPTRAGSPFSRTIFRCWRRFPSVRPVSAVGNREIEEPEDERKRQSPTR